MREATPPQITTADHWEVFLNEFSCSDHRAHPGEVLQQMDELLEEHGLEIVTVDNKDDGFWYKIEELQVPEKSP